MKNRRRTLPLFAAVCLCLSACAADPAPASEPEKTGGGTGGNFFDLRGDPLTLESCDTKALELCTAIGWTWENEEGVKLENGRLLNGLELFDVYSRYAIRNSPKDPDFHAAVMCEAGYSLINAEDAFKSFRLKGIVFYRSDGLGSFYVFRPEGDEYFPFVSARHVTDLGRDDMITVNGEKVAVQPLPIRIDSELASESFEDGCAYEAELSFETVTVTAYPQQAVDEAAVLNDADGVLTRVCSFEKVTASVP